MTAASNHGEKVMVTGGDSSASIHLSALTDLGALTDLNALIDPSALTDLVNEEVVRATSALVFRDTRAGSS